MPLEREFDSTNYITLKQFQGGWIWIKNITETSTRILPPLTTLSLEQMQDIADLLNGELLPWKIFNDTQWVLRLMPLPDFIILIVLNSDEEFGSELKIFYHKSSLIVPTEDVYVFTEIFLDLLGLFAKSGIEKATSIQFQNEVISLADHFALVDPANKEKLWNDIIGQREAPLLKIDKKTAEQISKKLNSEFFSGEWQQLHLEWGLKFDILKNLSIFTLLPLSKQNFQVFYTKNVLNYESRRVGFFTWLYCNAIIREARTILGDKLPKLSEYL